MPTAAAGKGGKKLGGLPWYVWAAAAAGGLLLGWFILRRSGGGSSTVAGTGATGAPAGTTDPGSSSGGGSSGAGVSGSDLLSALGLSQSAEVAQGEATSALAASLGSNLENVALGALGLGSQAVGSSFQFGSDISGASFGFGSSIAGQSFDFGQATLAAQQAEFQSLVQQIAAAQAAGGGAIGPAPAPSSGGNVLQSQTSAPQRLSVPGSAFTSVYNPANYSYPKTTYSSSSPGFSSTPAARTGSATGQRFE